jgi:hypothetical protein
MSAILEQAADPGDARVGRFIVPCPACDGGDFDYEDYDYAGAARDRLVSDMCVLCSGLRRVARIVAERYYRTRPHDA